MSSLIRSAAALLCAVASGMCAAQAYPVRPVVLVVTSTTGGGMDTITRAVGQRLSAAWGQPVLIDNRPGANDIIATEHVVRAAADGHMLLVSSPSVVNNASLYSKLPYDAARDLTPVTGMVIADLVLAINPAVPARSLQELIAVAKSKPGELTYASIGMGSPAHLAMEMLQAMAGIRLNHIPYKGSAPALTDVAAGHVQMTYNSVAAVMSFAKGNKVRVLAVGSTKRTQRYPELPTIAESGLPGFEAATWFGLHAPAKTPRFAVERINAEVRTILADPAFRAKSLDPQGFEPMSGSPEEFAGFLKSEASKWSKVIREARVQLD